MRVRATNRWLPPVRVNRTFLVSAVFGLVLGAAADSGAFANTQPNIVAGEVAESNADSGNNKSRDTGIADTYVEFWNKFEGLISKTGGYITLYDFSSAFVGANEVSYKSNNREDTATYKWNGISVLVSNDNLIPNIKSKYYTSSVDVQFPKYINGKSENCFDINSVKIDLLRNGWEKVNFYSPIYGELMKSNHYKMGDADISIYNSDKYSSENCISNIVLTGKKILEPAHTMEGK